MVSPHCGATLDEIFTAELLCRDVISLEYDEKHHCKQRKQSHSLMLIHSYYVSRIHGHFRINFKDRVSIFPANVLCTFLKKKSWSNSNVTLVNERQQITWRHAQNVLSLIFVNFDSALLCELIASQLVAIATRGDAGSHKRLDLISILY
jgi:hypothetical protein